MAQVLFSFSFEDRLNHIPVLRVSKLLPKSANQCGRLLYFVTLVVRKIQNLFQIDENKVGA